MSIKKFILLIFFALFLFFPSFTHADLVPLECMPLSGKKPPAYCMYGNYKGPLYPRIVSINPLLGLSLNFALVLLATTVFSFISSKKIGKKIIIYSIGITLVGLIVDSISLLIASGVHGYYYAQYSHTTEFLVDSFFAALFFSSFILLSVTYIAIYTLMNGKKINRSIIIIAIVLALINNPYWFLKYM